MAALSHTKSRRLYSWWWDSHISPKNSKWLQENLTDMDSKLKAMIKLIEEDADSFARRAEMYYKKRPELMKLVEEFYRAYRALAEKYDHATVVIRQAHRTMEEAFPNQDSSGLVDDSPVGDDPRTPPQRNGVELSTSNLCDTNRRVRKGLNFDQVGEPDEILILKKAIAEVEAEKEAGIIQYQVNLENLAKLESKISLAQDDSRELNERASKAESEVQKLKEALSEVEAQKDANLREYLEKISSLEAGSVSLRDKLEKVTSEKDAALDQFVLSLEKISNLENKLEFSEEDARKSREQAEKAETQIETLKQEISKLFAEKEALAIQYKLCLVTISSLENKLSSALEEVQQLRTEIDDGVSKCLLLETVNQTLHYELESVTLKMGVQDQELTEKQKELDQRNALQQEIYSLNEELNGVNKKHLSILEHVKAVGLNPECLKSSVKELQDENSNLKEIFETEKCEKEALVRKLEILGQLLEKNSILENSLADLSVELEAAGGKIKALEKSCQSFLQEKLNLLDEKSDLGSQLQAANENLEKLSVNNTVLKNSLSDAHFELHTLRSKLRSVEDSHQLLADEKVSLAREYDIELDRALHSEIEIFILRKYAQDLIDTRESMQDLQQANLKIFEEKRLLTEELQKQMNENVIWERQAGVIFSQLQTSSISQVIYKQKIHELIEECKSLKHENTVKDTDMKLLGERVSSYASENEGLNARLVSYGPAITSLRECISSLESKTMDRKLRKPTNQELEDENLKVTDSSLDLQDLPKRVRAIEKTVVEIEQLVFEENSNVHSQLEAGLRQIEELKSQNSLHRRSLKPKSEISEVDNALMTKDIMLDHVSESSAYAISLREQVEADNQICELWETADKDDSIGLTVGKVGKVKKMVTLSPEKNFDLRRLKSVRKKRRDYPSSDALLMKELSVDKLEISKNSISSVQEGNNRKVLQRLNSDVQKLTNLQITVQDLKRKLEIINNGKKGKAIEESASLKGQLEEAEATILKLLNLNGKLAKSVEDSSFSSDIRSAMEYEDSECIRRRRISEQARRISEKIGRLQLEVQKIQFFLLKLDDEKESKGKNRMTETKRRVLLKDFLYGGTRVNQSKRKKATFCACVQPPTYGD